MPRFSKTLLLFFVLTLVGLIGLAVHFLRTSDASGRPEGLAGPGGERTGSRADVAPASALAAAAAGAAGARTSSDTQGAFAAAAPLMYSQAWYDDMPSALAEFRDWTMRYARAQTGIDEMFLEMEGLPLVRARRQAMYALIEADPELAIAYAVPAALREILPRSIEEQLETRIAGRGDYEILMAVQPIGSRRPEEEFHRVTIDGRTWDAFVYGRRAFQQSQEGASLHGIAIDDRMAVHESPLRVLEPDEALALAVPARPCPVSAGATTALPPGVLANRSAPTVIEADGQLWQLASPDLLDMLEALLVAAEDQPGPAVPAVLAGEPVLPLPPTSWTSGPKTLLILRVDFSDRPGDPYTFDAINNLINNSINPYYDNASYGSTTLVTTVAPTTYRMPQTAEWYATGNRSSQLYTDATAAASGDFTASQFQHVMIVFARLNNIADSQFTWAGLGSLGGGRTWINGYYDFRVVSHELGHNYGLHHANLWQVNDGNPASASGSSTEYADPFDAMGGGSTNANHHFNHWFKNRLGWLPDASVVPVTASGTYRITRFDHKDAPLDQNLALNIFCDGRRTFWVGFRQNLTNNTSVFNGAYVLWGFGNGVQSQLLDMTTPGSSANDAGLQIGNTFTDAARGVSIRPIAKGGTAPAQYLDVEITLGQPASPFAVAWGSSQTVSAMPESVTAVRALAAGSQHALALRTDGTVSAWGSNTAGQTSLPADLASVIAISARANASGAVRADGTVAVWGGTTAQASVPASLSGVSSLSIGVDHVLALRTDGTVVAWGDNSHGESTVPGGLTGVASIAAGNNTSYAVRSNGTVVRWGATQGTMPALTGVTAVAAGHSHALALRSDGTVIAWGDNTYGQSSVPVGLTGATAVAASALHSVAVRADGTIVQWGGGSAINSLPPAVSRVSALAVNDSSTLIVIGSSPVASSPTITGQPQDRAIIAGQSTTFTVAASGAGTLGHQWQRQAGGAGSWTNITNNATYAGATAATLTVSGSTTGMSGDRFRCVVSLDGATPTTSSAATLTVSPALAITTQPVATAGVAGGSLTLSVVATGPGTLTYQWRLNGVAIAGATSASYTVPSAQAYHAGTYTVVVTSGGSSVTSAGAAVTVNPAPASTARLMNLSTRGLALTGGDVLIPGFVIDGSGTKRLLIRAVGPTLIPLGVSDALPDPQLVLKRFDTATHSYVDVMANDNWGTNANAAQIASTASTLGAFALGSGSADAAVLADLAPGRYTVVANGVNNATGVAMVELYDADAGTPTARLVNISNRGYVGTSSHIMIPGFVVSNEGSRTFLIRAVGPTLGTLGVSGVLADPQLTIFSGGTPILGNNDWDGIAGSATTTSVAAQVGAFPLGAGSKDAALVVTLPPGAYTVQASGVGNTTGIALVEIYLVP